MALSPMMQQYLEVKKQYPDALIFYRLGDFYEMFFDDAKKASKELELTLTGRDCGLEERAPMCGVPYHAADSYIGKLVNKGYKVVVCEQMENPKDAVGLVKRDVVRIVTPGTVTDNTQLEEGENNYICGIYAYPAGMALAVADISTGELKGTFFEEDAEKRLLDELAAYDPREVLFNQKAEEAPVLFGFIKERLHSKVYDRMPVFENASAFAAFTRFIGSPSGYPEDEQNVVVAVGGLLSYISGSLRQATFRAKELRIYKEGQYLSMDSNTRRNLELCRTMRDNEKRGSLLWVLDRTKTAMGARLLRQYVEQPLMNQRKILYRQGAVVEFFENYLLHSELQELLSGISDLERISSRVVFGSAGGKDLRALANTMKQLPAVKEQLKECKSEALRDLYDRVDPLSDLCAVLDRGIKEDSAFFDSGRGLYPGGL